MASHPQLLRLRAHISRHFRLASALLAHAPAAYTSLRPDTSKSLPSQLTLAALHACRFSRSSERATDIFWRSVLIWPAVPACQQSLRLASQLRARAQGSVSFVPPAVRHEALHAWRSSGSSKRVTDISWCSSSISPAALCSPAKLAACFPAAGAFTRWAQPRHQRQRCFPLLPLLPGRASRHPHCVHRQR